MGIVIVGGGAAGISAALSASEKTSDVLLVESESTIGGDLFSGMPLLGAYTSCGECCVHGVLDKIIAACKQIDPAGYIGPVCDWRTVYGLCFNPEILRLAVTELLRKQGVKLLLNSTVCSVKSEGNSVQAVRVVGRNGRIHIIDCDCVIDASGGGHIVSMAGGEVFWGDENREFQPISQVFRMANVKLELLLRFVRDNPGEVLLSENPIMGKTRNESAKAVYEAGFPYIAISANGNLLGQAIKDGSIHPCTAAFITPTSMLRGEVCMNVTRLAGIDCTDDYVVSTAMLELSRQTVNIARFFKKIIPGFENAVISSIAHRVGIRETGRIRGEYTLSQSDVVNAVRHTDVIARGAHHVDIHGAGTAQVRIPVKDGQSYDIPYGCLIPVGLKNVIAAGRCLSSDRGANGAARVMGTCIATGQAAGLAASIFFLNSKKDFRETDSREVYY